MNTRAKVKISLRRRAKADGEPKKGKKIVGIVALLAVAAAAYFLVLKPKSEGDPEPVAGEVVTLEPIQLNLAAGSYLRIAIALQLTAEAEEADGSRALDATIEMFSGRTVAQLSDLKQRKKLKEDLAAEVKELYDGEVMDLYITEFVAQYSLELAE